ncbi:DUF2786 domain-containing protein [Lentzea sp. CC55]|uniref:DUF2786 domain-containing protein n=1 Tax=Lentzea sp. CC55 TaxID=2884909 RepID=UPI001F2E84D6|nr:DUF2786 domain-containing protein [Lentzea sp. CC55]MCG8926627.1 DUF2786 domain-containing protein [Lentzea sp. CC55]
MDDANDKIKGKIAGLLAKAESTTPEEAEALTAHAERLMQKYRIDRAMLAARGGRQAEEPIEERHIIFTGTYGRSLLRMGISIARAYGNLTVLQLKGKDSTLILWGYRSDVEQAELLVRSLHMQAISAMSTWWRDLYKPSWWGTAEKTAQRKSFLVGFGLGAAQRMGRSQQEALQAAESGAELVLLDRAKRVELHVHRTIKVGKSRRVKTQVTAEGLQAGRQAGEQADVGEKRIERERRALSR